MLHRFCGKGIGFLCVDKLTAYVGHARQNRYSGHILKFVIYFVAIVLYRSLISPQLRSRDLSGTAPLVIAEPCSPGMRTHVSELPGVSFAAGLPFAVCYVPRHFVYLNISSGKHRLTLAFIKGIEHVGRGMYPVVHRGSRKSQAKFGEHLHLTVFGKMMIEFIVYKRGKQIGSDMTASYDAVRTGSLDYPGRRRVFVTFETKYRCYGLFHPQPPRFQMKHTGLVLSDHFVFLKVDSFGIYRLCLYGQTVSVIFPGTLAAASCLSLGLGTTLGGGRIHFPGDLFQLLGGGQFRLFVKFAEQ